MAVTLIGYRGRNDDGNETTATPKAPQNTRWIQAKDENFRVRFLHQNDTSLINNLDIQLQYSLNGGAFTNVTATSTVVRSSASPNLADAANLTTQLTGGTGTYQGATGFDEVNGICGGNSMDITSTGHFETEFCVQVRSADVTDGDVIQLRTINSDSGSPWGTYDVVAELNVTFIVGSSEAQVVISTEGSGIVEAAVSVIGITIDGHLVFDNDVDELGRKVVTAATSSTPGFLDAGGSTQWLLTSAAEIVSGSSEAAVIVSAEAAGQKIAAGASESAVTVTAEGSGQKIGAGSQDAGVSIAAEGSGTKIASGSAEAIVSIDPEAAGRKLAAGSADASVVVSVEGSGVKITSGSADAIVDIAVESAGRKLATGSAEAVIVISTEGAGETGAVIAGGSESSVVITASASGVKTTSGSNEAAVEVEPEGLGIKSTTGSSEAAVDIAVEGAGQVTFIFSGGSEAELAIASEAAGQKIAVGTGDASLLVTPEGTGQKFVSGSNDAVVIIRTQGAGGVTGRTSVLCFATIEIKPLLSADITIGPLLSGEIEIEKCVYDKAA